ncbi:hypothetical protein AKO1_003314 [Acrasis kona]|uniref:Histidine kinase n=1 Tax=Acrasis kona TaxID=1008807 RepID=A0AAW2Z914_9EUKA
MRLRAKKKNISLELEIAPETPTMLLGDAPRLDQVIVNLVNNAIKFTHEGGRIVVSIYPSPCSIPNSSLLEVKVQDNGIGIPSHLLPLLFNNYSQLHGGHFINGTGLGLAISKSVVEKMKGKMWVESAENVGSTFYFNVVLGKYHENCTIKLIEPAARQSDIMTDDNFNPILQKILIVEDNMINKKVLKSLLKKIGCVNINVASNGQEAYMACMREHFDLVLMDCNMPIMDGYTSTQKIRSHQSSSGQPRSRIVALTANATTSEKQKCFDAGMDAFVSKPIRINVLRDLVGSLADEERIT